MGEEEEVREMVERLLESVLRGRKRKKVKAPPPRPGVKVERPGPGSPHGIYVYDHEEKKWVLAAVEGSEWKPSRSGIHFAYFDNTKCPACRIYDKHWFEFVEKHGGEIGLVIILCAWFARECLSTAASASFKTYSIHASPTTLVVCRQGDRNLWVKKYEGVLTLEELIAIYAALRGKCRIQES